MAGIRVYLTEPISSEAQNLLASRVTLDVGDLDVRGAALFARLAEADVFFSKTDPIKVDEELLRSAPKLRLVARHGSGYSNVDMAAATARGILVTSTPGANSVTMAEYTLGLMFASARRIPAAAEASRGGDPERLQFMGMELAGKTFGIIGVGSIGKAVVTRVHALGMRILAYHPRPSAKDLAVYPLTLVDLPTLLRESDVVSIHSPLTEQTRNMIGSEELALMRRTTHLLNLGRGGIVCEDAVCAALHANRLAGYATDVLAHEPVRAGDPLLTAPNAIVLPHIAAVTREAQAAVAMTAVEDILRFAAGETPRHVINKELLAR